MVKLDGYWLTDVRYLSPNHLSGVLPALSSAGTYSLVVTNPDGQSATLQNAYHLTALIPSINKVSPAYGYNNFSNLLTISGSGFTNGSVVKISTGSETSLDTYFVSASLLTASIPANFSAGTYDLTVTNPDSQTSQTVIAAYQSLEKSYDGIVSIENGIWLNPNAWVTGTHASMGITLHREGGSVPFTNLPLSFYLDEVTPANKIGDAQISILVPNQNASSTSISITTPAAGNYTLLVVVDPDGQFKALHPNLNLPADPIQQTIRVLPQSIDTVPPVIQDFILGGAGTKTTHSGTLQFHTIATDADPGSGVASLLYTESTYSQAAGTWMQVNSSGWIPVGADPYPWQLSSEGGVKYLQVWAADKSGNVSQPVGRWINYIPASEAVDQGMTRIYRYSLTAGQQLVVSLQPDLGEDADLYLWGEIGGIHTLLAWSYQGAGMTDTIRYTAPAGGIEVQLEVYGYTNATYQLTDTIDGVPAYALRNPITIAKELPSQPAVNLESAPPSQVRVPDAPISDTNHYFYLPVVGR